MATVMLEISEGFSVYKSDVPAFKPFTSYFRFWIGVNEFKLVEDILTHVLLTLLTFIPLPYQFCEKKKKNKNKNKTKKQKQKTRNKNKTKKNNHHHNNNKKPHQFVLDGFSLVWGIK